MESPEAKKLEEAKKLLKDFCPTCQNKVLAQFLKEYLDKCNKCFESGKVSEYKKNQ